MNPQIYLPWLYNELRARGVQFVRKKVESIAEPAEYLTGKGAVVNATALGPRSRKVVVIVCLSSIRLGARSLIGVQDQDVYPIRGQAILAYAPDVQEFLSYPLGLGSSSQVSRCWGITELYGFTSRSQRPDRPGHLHDSPTLA